MKEDSIDQIVQTREWLREKSYGTLLGGMLAHLEGDASSFYLGLDYDTEDISDIDGEGPF